MNQQYMNLLQPMSSTQFEKLYKFNLKTNKQAKNTQKLHEEVSTVNVIQKVTNKQMQKPV